MAQTINNGIHIRFRLLDAEGNILDQRNDRYPLVTKAISLRNKGQGFELQMWDSQKRMYVRDNQGYQRMDDRPTPKGREGKSSTTNTELIRAFQTVAEASRAMAASVRAGEDTAQSIDEWFELATNVLVVAGYERKDVLDALNAAFPKKEASHA